MIAEGYFDKKINLQSKRSDGIQQPSDSLQGLLLLLLIST